MMNLRNLCGGGGEPAASEGEVKQLTDQFYVTLEAYFSKIKSEQASLGPDAVKTIATLLTQPHNWTNAYAIEQLLVHAMSDETIANELPVRVREARTALRPPLADHYATEAAKQGLTPDQRRTLLGRLVNDLQWRYTVNEAERRYSRGITVAVAWFFMLSLIAFAGVILVPVRRPDLAQVQLLLLLPALFAGTWGAAFSLLSNLQSRLKASELDDLKVIRAKSVILSRLLIGAGAASILFFFFVSGLMTSLVSGAAVPNLTVDALKTDWLRNLALLVVWCFVAGFSERLIPDLITRTEGKFDGRSTSERFRPDAPPPTSAPSPAPSGAAPSSGQAPSAPARS
jgi:hypothetical protein